MSLGAVVTGGLLAACGTSGAAGASSVSTSSPSTAKTTTVSIAIPGTEQGWQYYFYAQYSNVCAPYNVKIETKVLTPTAAEAAVVSGSVDLTVGGTQVVDPLANKSLSGAVVLGEAGTFPGTGIYATKGITSLAGLVGKTVVAASPGGSAELIPQLALQKSGINPSKVKFYFSGSYGADIAAIASGKAQAALFSAPLPPALSAVGFHEIVSLQKLGLTYAFDNFIAGKTSWVKSHASAAEEALRCFGAALKASRQPGNAAAVAAAATKAGVPGGTSVLKNTVVLNASSFAVTPVSLGTLAKFLSSFLHETTAKANAQAKTITNNSYIRAAKVNVAAVGD